MRFSDRIIFLIIDRFYDVEAGRFEESTRYDENGAAQDIVPCFVMSLGLNDQVKIFGDFKRDRIVVFLQREYKKKYDRIWYGEFFYRVSLVRNNVFYLERDVSVSGIH